MLPQNKQFRFPSFAQWRQLPRVLGRGEKVVLFGLVFVFAISSFSLAKELYLGNTSLTPTKGGGITEGIVGSPRFLNPVYADTNDVDRDLVQLIYSGILRYNAQGALVPDLAAKEPAITEGGKVIAITLKENITWHDGVPLTADDVLFTIRTIQDPAYKSPIRANWLGVDVEKVSDFTVRFHLLDPYAPFLERLTLKILPAHIWEDITPENFTLTPLNLQPIGTGPYRVAHISQTRTGMVQEIQLKIFENYHSQGPFIESVVFRFFDTEEELIKEANRGTIQSFSLAQIANIQRMKNPAFLSYSFPLPRYFALFFNLDPPADKKQFLERGVREALLLALNKQELLTNVFGGNARVVDSPLLPSIFDFGEPNPVNGFNQAKALALLEQAGYTKEQGKIGKPKLTGEALKQDLSKGSTGEEVRLLQQCLAQDATIYPEGTVNGNFGQLTNQAVIRFQEKYATDVLTPLGLTKGTGKVGPLTRDKLNLLCFVGDGEPAPLTLTIATVDHSPLKEVAAELSRQWTAFGITVEIQTLSSAALERDVMKPRAYQALLFGEVLGMIPDPFPFWHSSQAKAPGLNLSAYNNKAVDKLLEDARKEMDSVKRLELFSEMQELIATDVPAIFLYDVDYTYFASKEVQGITASVIANPSQRFAEIEKWYIKTKRAPK